MSRVLGYRRDPGYRVLVAPLRYIGPKVWLGIQINIRESPSLKVFINLYRNYLIGHYSNRSDD